MYRKTMLFDARNTAVLSIFKGGVDTIPAATMRLPGGQAVAIYRNPCALLASLSGFRLWPFRGGAAAGPRGSS
jgi:hypothetical protein